MMLKGGQLEIDFEWDHGPDFTIVFYGKRTHILSTSWSAYPVLGGKALRKDYEPPHFFGPLERMAKAWPRHGKTTGVVNAMIEAMENIANDPLTEAIEEGALNADGVFDHDARTLRFPNNELYELTFYPPGDEGMRRLMEELPVPPPGKTLSVKALMEAMWRAVSEPDTKDGDYTA